MAVWLTAFPIFERQSCRWFSALSFHHCRFRRSDNLCTFFTTIHSVETKGMDCRRTSASYPLDSNTVTRRGTVSPSWHLHAETTAEDDGEHLRRIAFRGRRTISVNSGR